MTDKAPNYRIWRSLESVRIVTDYGAIELSIADVIAIVAEITAEPTVPRKSRAEMGAPEFLAECVRLYVDENLGLTRTSRRLGVSTYTVRSRLISAGVQLRTKPHTLLAAQASRAARAALRAV